MRIDFIHNIIAVAILREKQSNNQLPIIDYSQ